MSSATEANNRWRKNNRKVIQITITPEENEMIHSAASNNNKSMTRYLIELVKKDIGEENSHVL